MHDPDVRNAPRQLVTVFRHFTTLVQDELALARVEVARNLSRAGVGIALIVVAALMALVALNILATALVGVLTANGLSLWLAALLIGGALLLVALVLALVGKSRLAPDALAPTRSMENVKRDIEHLKEAGDG